MMRVKRILSLLLVCCMMFSSLPVTALAVEVSENRNTGAEVEVSPEIAASLVTMLTGEEASEPVKTDDGYLFDMPESMVDTLTSAVDEAADSAGIDPIERDNAEFAFTAEENVPTEDSANDLPEDYVDNSNDALYAMLEKMASTPMPLDGSLVGTKIDLFFVIDSTGSMSSYISNVKSNVAEFARSIGATGATLRLGLIDYRDITVDGKDSTRVHQPAYSPWMDVAGFVNELTTVKASGGGDTPETPLDALGELVKPGVGWSSDAYKFAMLITDAGYKTNNNHGIVDMDEMIRLLQEKNIFVSTITPERVATSYGELAALTGGVQIVLSSDFSSDMMDYAEAVIGTVSTEKKPTKDYVVRVVDDGTGLPVTGAQVSWKGGSTTTDDTGTAKITSNTSPVKDVRIARDGYAPLDLGNLDADADVKLVKLTVDPDADATDIPTLTPSMFQNPSSGEGVLKGPSLEFLGKKFNLIDNVDVALSLPLFSSAGRSVQRDLSIANGAIKIINDKDNKTFKVTFDPGWNIEGTDFKDPYGSYWQDDYQRYKSLVKGFSKDKSDKDIYNEFRTLRKTHREPKKKGDIALPVDFDFTGYAEMSYASGSLDIMEGGIIIAATSKTFERTASFPPQPWIFLKVTLSANLTGKFGFIKVTTTAKTAFDPKIDLTFRGESTLTLNAGVRRLAYVGGGLKGDLDASLKLPIPEGKLENGLTIDLSGKFTVEFKLLGIKKSKDFGNIGPARLYPWGSGRSIDTYSLDSESFTRIGRPSPISDMSRESFAYQKNSVYEDSAPQLIQLSDGSWLLVWVDAVEGRSDANMTGLYYSYRPASGSWSEPALVEDDGTGDFMPTLALSADGKPILAWQNVKTAWTVEPEEVEDIAKNLELKAAAYDTASNTFGTASTLVSNDQYNTAVQIAFYGTGAAAYWIETDPSNLLLGGDLSCTIYQSIWDGSAWSTPAEMTTVGSLDGFAAGSIGGSNCVAYASGGSIFCAKDGGAFTEVSSGDASSLQIAAGRLYWSDESGLKTWNGSSVNNDERLAPEDFTVLTDGSQTVMLIRQYTNNAHELAASIYTATGWSQPVAVTDYTNKNLSTPSAVLGQDGNIYWACGRFITETNGESELETRGSDLIVDSYVPASDVRVGKEAYISDLISAGEDVYAAVDLENCGLMSTAVTATVQINDGAPIAAGIYRFGEEDPIPVTALDAGEFLSAGILFTAPTAINGETVTITFSDASGNILGIATSKLPDAAPDLEVTAVEAKQDATGVTITATVRNIGSVDASNATITLTQEGVADTVLASQTVSLAVGANETITLTAGTDADLIAKSIYDYKRFIVTAEPLDGEVNVGNNSNSALIAPTIPTAISINGEDTVAMKGGETRQLTCTAAPAGAPLALAWMSSNNSVVTVAADGTISAWGNGTATITAVHIAPDGTSELRDSIIVTVTEGISSDVNAVNSVSIDQRGTTVGVGKTVALSAVISPSTAVNKSVEWFVKDTDILRIADSTANPCTVEGLAEGETTVTVRTVDGAYTDTVTVKVSASGTIIPPIPPTDTPDTSYITIPQFPNGTITPTTRNAAPGERVTLYAHPDDGYELDTLTVKDIRGRNITLRSMGDNAYSFLMPASRVTVDASFVKVAADTPATTPAEDEPFTGLGTPGISGIVLNPGVMPFTDVKSTDWFYNNVDYVWKHYLMSGVSDTQFAPNLTTSRAMIWTILARMHNVRTDINPGSTWYEKGLLWAREQGVTDGTDPMSDITREQLATMLWRNAGRPAPGAAADLSRFSDSDTVSSYAQTAVRWAASVGILNGSDGKIDPQGTATRAQVAAMVARYGDRIA